MDAKEYTNARIASLQGSVNPYPHKWPVNETLPHFRTKYESLGVGETKEEQLVYLAGRIDNIRSSGKALFFYDLVADGIQLQIMAHKQQYATTNPVLTTNATDSQANSQPQTNTGISESFESVTRLLHRGDILGVAGYPHRTKRGELSLLAKQLCLLSPCLHMLPVIDPKNRSKEALTDKETRYRQRYLDLMVNPGSRKTMVTRSKIISFLRRYLEDLDFLEVETPILNLVAGGATARPFRTHHNELDIEMYLRIAPELPLKQAVIGGLDRVFEIGKQFRNEGIDLTHNPEFTTCEFYWAYQDYHDLMKVTEDLLFKMVCHLNNGNPVVQYNGQEINFTPPFPRVPMIRTLEAALDCQLTDLDSEATRQLLLQKATERKIVCPAPQTTARLLDRLVGELLEPGFTQPTFLIDHPLLMSPLAKVHRDHGELTERFELFLGGKEVCNAYTELNSPFVQRERFAQQQLAKNSGDEEIPPTDEDYCRALEYGLPPTAGWGLGIDRLTMFLTDQQNIKEVILFPPVKQEKITNNT